MSVSTCTYTSKSGKRVKLIHLEMAGVKSVSIDDDYKNSDPGCSAVQIKAAKEKVDSMEFLAGEEDVKKDERILPDLEKPDVHEEESDSCRYGEICKTFQIPLDYEFMIQGGEIIWVGDGTVYLAFAEKEKRKIGERVSSSELDYSVLNCLVVSF